MKILIIKGSLVKNGATAEIANLVALVCQKDNEVRCSGKSLPRDSKNQ